MFSGIIEAQSEVITCAPIEQGLRVRLQRPENFKDIKLGDSISVNGVCLTVEEFSEKELQFAIGAETLRVTAWTDESLRGKSLNLERSLEMGARNHGHFVSGHVDINAKVVACQRLGGEQLRLTIEIPQNYEKYLWKKGSVAINGVSLTVNNFEKGNLEVGLIPETLKRTNLSELKTGDLINLEVDQMARAMVSLVESAMASGNFHFLKDGREQNI